MTALLRAHPSRADEARDAARRLGRVSVMQALLEQAPGETGQSTVAGQRDAQ
nr:hypothetical protein [Cupriavidus gilardii]